MSDASCRLVLPRTVLPTHYELEYTRVDLAGAYVFAGQVRTHVRVVSATSVVTMHARDLEITHATIAAAPDGASPGAAAPVEARAELDAESQMLDLHAPSELSPGAYTVTVGFAGTLASSLAGFYRSKSSAPDGTPSVMACTQFEPTDARRAFPCWDEPSFLADFTLTLVGPADALVLGNMPPESVCVLSGADAARGTDGCVQQRVRFQTLPQHPTYLYAWVIGGFDVLAQRGADGVHYRVLVQHGDLDRGRYALSCAQRSLAWLARLFAMPYQYPKLDLVTVPDFAAGAMENTGLVTYRPARILLEPATASVASRIDVAYTIAHENTHQWCGNTAVPYSFQYLWLNEAFATFVGWWCVDRLEPTWKVFTRFLVNVVSGGMALDALETTHPVEVPLADPRDVNEIFDAISYLKGASILWQLFAHAGEDAFTRGVRLFMQRFKQKNVRTDDLLRCLSEASGKELAAFMRPWVLKPGFPVVDVALETVDGAPQVVLRQRRFLSSPLAQDAARADTTRWNIPVAYRIGRDGAEHMVLFGADAPGGTCVLPETAGWKDTYLKVNTGQTGFYRCRYAPELYARLLAVLKTDRAQISERDRIGIAGDVFALAAARQVPVADALELASTWCGEDTHLVWSTLAGRLGGMLALFRPHLSEAGVRALARFVRSVYAPALDRVGWHARADEDEDAAQLRAVLLGGLAGHGEHARAGTLLSGCFDAFWSAYACALEAGADADLAAAGTVSSELRGIAFRHAARSGGAAALARLQRIVETSKETQVRLAAIRALGRAGTAEDLVRMLDYALATIEPSNMFLVIAYGAGNARARGGATVWAWMKAHWDQLYDMYKGGIFLLGRLIESSLAGLATAADVADVKTFFAARDQTGIRMTLAQSTEVLRARVLRITEDTAAVEAWLTAHVAALPAEA